MEPAPVNSTPDRPEFMVKLGLLPPYTLEDVDAAYRDKAKAVHPDRNGSAAEFKELREAVECARAHVQIRQGRRQWLANNVDRYVAQEEVCGAIRRRGGQCELEDINWLKQSLGDFAVVTERLRVIRLRDQADGDALLDYLFRNKPALEYMVHLDLAGSHVTDNGMSLVGGFRGLSHLNLARTHITEAGLKVIPSLPNLQWLNLARTSVGCLARHRLRRACRRLAIVTADTP